MTVSELTPDEMMNSLTGYDEIAITKTFGADVLALRERPTTLLRSLVFVDARRNGEKDLAAHATAMTLTLKDIEGYFADEPEELDPEAPDSEVGKEFSPLD